MTRKERPGLNISFTLPTVLLFVALSITACTPSTDAASTGAPTSRAVSNESFEGMNILLSPEFVERLQKERHIILEMEFPQTAYEREITRRGLVVENGGRLVGDLYSLNDSDTGYKFIYDMDGNEYGSSTTSEVASERGYLTAAVRREGNLIMKVVFEWNRLD